MNKFQQERKQVFQQRILSRDKQQAVIEAVNNKHKAKKWVPLLVSGAVAAIALFLLFSPTDVEEPQMTATSFEQAMDDFYGTNPEAEILYTQMPYLTKNDGLVITKTVSEYGVAYDLIRSEFVEGNWRTVSGSSIYGYEDYKPNYTKLKDDFGYFIAGYVSEGQVNHVYLGDKEPVMLSLEDGGQLWYGYVQSDATPVFYEKDGERKRVTENERLESSYIPVVEAVNEQQVVHYEGDAMERGGSEYTEFPLVLDPYYYAQNPYRFGDVVAVMQDGKLEITRYISEGFHSITMEEGSLLFDNQFVESLYTMGNWNGDSLPYSTEKIDLGTLKNPDELFVMPDNWASDGVRGVISKEQIVGKVIGYSLMNIEEPWLQVEIGLYEKFALEKDEELLIDIPAQQIVRMQLYAKYKGDYETVFALYSRFSMNKTYEEWAAVTNFEHTEQVKQLFKYDAYGAILTKFYEDESLLEWRDTTSGSTLLTFPVEKENGVWKVKYDTVKRVY